MKHLFIFLLSGLLVFPFQADAQITPQKKRQVLYSVMQMMENYEMSYLCDTDANEENFRNLFVSEEVKIYNDLLGFSGSESLSVPEYISIIQNKVKNPTIRLKNIRYKDIVDEGSNYLVTVLFEKELSYSNECGVLFSSQDYYGKDYMLEASVLVDKNSLEGKISKVSGHISSDKPALVENQYYIMEKASFTNQDIKCNGKEIEFNSFEQAFLPAEYSFSHPDPDMDITVLKPKDGCPVVSLKYRLKKWSLAPFFEMSLMDQTEPEDDFNGALENTSSSLTEFGLVTRFTFPRKSRTKWSLNFGAGYSIHNIDLAANRFDFNYKTGTPKADVDGDIYQRYYSVTDMKESIKLTNVVIPVFLNMETRFGRRFSCYLQVGGKVYLNMSSEITEFSAQQYVYGVYNQYGKPIVFDRPEYWGYNNFGHSTLGMNNLETTELNSPFVTADAFAGLGFRLNIFGPVSLYAGARYQYGFMDIVKPDGQPAEISKGVVSENSAFVHYMSHGQGDTTKGLTNLPTTFKRSALNLNVGLEIKF